MTRILRLLLIAAVIATFSTAAFGAVFFSVNIAPPVLPVYTQPVCPGVGYIWTPGYWAYGPSGYFWVPGTWVLAPFEGALWTPGYWGWSNGAYLWNQGYWGLNVGFYGGINYGFGYTGAGYAGGYWNHGAFYYNRAVNNVDPAIVHNVYNKTVVNNFGGNRVSFNGGHGGTTAHATAAEMAAARGRRMGPTSTQTALRSNASTNRAQLASVNHGRPAEMATRTPGEFSAHGATAATRGATAKRAPANHAAARQQHGAVARNVPRANTPARRAPAASARNTARPASHAHSVPAHSVPARHVTQPNHATARHSAPPTSHYSARNVAPARRRAPEPSHYMAQHSTPAPRAAAPAHRAFQPRESAPRPAPAHNAAPRREGGRG